MKKIGFFIIALILLGSVFWSQLKLANHPATNNDEGIYLTSFLLVDKGYSSYKETFFSQPPGFILAVYPALNLLGKTLPMARLIVGLWSIIGLLAIIWIGFELENKWLGLLTIGLLYLIPYYTNQTLVLQSDLIVTTFSLLSLASFLRFINLKKTSWFIISCIFFNFAFWTKFEITLIPALVVVLYLKNKRQLLSYLGIFILISTIYFLIAIAPFGIKDVFTNTILYRIQSAKNTGFNPLELIYLLKTDLILFSCVLLEIFFVLTNRKKLNTSLLFILIWSFSTLIFFYFYRPLFDHHLAILSIPTSLLTISIFFDLIKKEKLQFIAISAIFALAIYQQINLISKASSSLLSPEQKQAVAFIIKNTQTNDLVVSDETVLNAVSNRLPPPWLSDLSYVRIYSGSLDSYTFNEVIKRSKPKLIISWNGRLKTLKNFEKTLEMENYKKTADFGNGKILYKLF